MAKSINSSVSTVSDRKEFEVMSRNASIASLKTLLRRGALRLRWMFSGYSTKLFGLDEIPFSNLTHLGTEYGGWFVSETQVPEHPILLGAGVGEDISFDLEFASLFGGKILLVDPTPRAVVHVDGLLGELDKPGSQKVFETGGKEVDISNLSREQVDFESKALFTRNGHVTFYPPKNRSHVSYSIANIQQGSTEASENITVEAVRVDKLLEGKNVDAINVAKFDIEGVAADVVTDMLRAGIKPNQILVELEELLLPTQKNKDSLDRFVEELLSGSYVLAHRHHLLNFLFIRT